MISEQLYTQNFDLKDYFPRLLDNTKDNAQGKSDLTTKLVL